MDNNIKKKIISNILSLFIIFSLLHYLIINWRKFENVLDFSKNYIILLSLLIFATWLIGSLQTILIMKEVKIKIGLFEGLFTLVAMALGNYLPMRVGTLIRMQYFKKIHNLQYSKFGGMYSARTLIMLASTGVFGFLGIVAISGYKNRLSLIVMALYFLLSICSCGLYFLSPPYYIKGSAFFFRVWDVFFQGYEAIRKSTKFFFQMIFLLFFQYIVLALRLYLSFHAIGKELPFFAYFVIAPSTVLISIFSLTPGNLGLREWIIGILTLTVGLDFNSGIFAGTLDRVVLMVCTFVFGFISFLYIRIRMNKAEMAL